MRIPFTKYDFSVTKRGINVIDSKTNLPIDFDVWINKFSLPNRTPILENIYDTIATEFSKIDLILSKDIYDTSDGQMKHVYVQQRDNPNYGILALRPNALQTKSELLYTVAYQLHMYRNALVKIIRADTPDAVLALEPLNCADYFFGQGYEIGDALYLKLKEKSTGKILLLDYGDLIHLRLSPNDIFYGDRNETVDLTSFIKIFDENLNALFNELKEAGKIKGIIEIGTGNFGGGGGFNAALVKKEGKISKQQEIIDRIKATKGGILVLDSGEKWVNLAREFKTMGADEVDNLMQYLYSFKGINQKVIDGTATEAQMGVFFNKTIMPIVERFVEELNYKFLTDIARAQGHTVEYFKNPFEYMATKELLSNLYLGAMFFSKNEIRRMAFKLPPIDGGDELIDNKNFTTGIRKTQEGGDGDGT